MKIFKPVLDSVLELPFYPEVRAGFPSPAENEDLRTIDLNSHLIKHPAATFFVRIAGDSMIGKGIYEGDLAVVDRSLQVKNGHIIIAFLNSQFTLKEFQKDKNTITLKAANKTYPDIVIKEGDEFEVWGVVTNVIHNLL